MAKTFAPKESQEPGESKVMSQRMGLAPPVSRPTNAVRLKHRAVPMPMPGAHAALLRRLFTGGK